MYENVSLFVAIETGFLISDFKMNTLFSKNITLYELLLAGL